jgi:AraC-like DNA-binding protein
MLARPYNFRESASGFLPQAPVGKVREIECERILQTGLTGRPPLIGTRAALQEAERIGVREAGRRCQGGDREPLSKIAGYLDRCFSRHSPPRVTELARYLGVSRGFLWQAFRLALRTTPCAYLRGVQVSYAARLLLETDLPVRQVALASAFDIDRTFFRTFRRLVGHSPTQFRKQNVTRLRAGRLKGWVCRSSTCGFR